MDLIEKEPSELGYEFGRWTTARLATYMEEETGIKLSGEQIRRILSQKKYAYLWAKYSLEDKQNPKKREAFKEKLQGYLEASKASPEKIQVWFWDESGFSLRVIRRKNWGKKGTRKKVTGQRSSGRVNIMGGVRFNHKKRIVLDNASYHKKKVILAEIEKTLPNIQLYFIPEYSPDFNLVELVWHSAKEYISHRLFKSVEQLRNLLDRLLNQGELIIQWGRKIKNKGDAAIAN